jgi:PadR family transcriptional regulator AphA
MQPSDGPALSLSAWLVLCLICEQPTHGNAIADLLGQGGPLSQVWRLHKSVVFLSLKRLEQLDLIRTIGTQPATKGPARVLKDATPAGRAAAVAWLDTPVVHARDVRSELLVKLALLDRAARDPRPLLAAQRTRLFPVARALRGRLNMASGSERKVVLWRVETISAIIRVLDELLDSPIPVAATPSEAPISVKACHEPRVRFVEASDASATSAASLTSTDL